MRGSFRRRWWHSIAFVLLAVTQFGGERRLSSSKAAQTFVERSQCSKDLFVHKALVYGVRA
jgi:hypothetical protein